MNKFYKYLIYRLYSYALKTNNSTPEESVVITLLFTHYIQFMTILFLTTFLFPEVGNIINFKNKLFFILFLGTAYFLVRRLIFNKEKWETYLQLFKGESKSESNKGFWLCFLYIGGSFLLFFVVVYIGFMLKLGRNNIQ